MLSIAMQPHSPEGLYRCNMCRCKRKKKPATTYSVVERGVELPLVCFHPPLSLCNSQDDVITTYHQHHVIMSAVEQHSSTLALLYRVAATCRYCIVVYDI